MTDASEFRGVIVAAITPRRDSGHQVDLAAALDVIDYISAREVKGIALLGATGEFPHFDVEERMRLASFAIKRSGVPVLVNVSHSSLDGAVALAEAAVEAGAAGLLLAPPYFFRYSQAEIREFYLRFAEELGAGAAPVFLYNLPFFTNEIAVETAVELLSGGCFAGIKDSSGRFDYLLRLRELRGRRPLTLLVGNDVVFTQGRSAGAHGVISGVACAVPELMLALDRAIAAAEAEKIDRLEARLQEFLRWLDCFPTPVGVKEATALRGVGGGPFSTPLARESARKLGEFREWFQAWLPDLLKECRGG